MKCLSTRFCGSGDATEYAATSRLTLKRFALNCMPALVAGTCLASLLLIALHGQPSRVLPPDRGHQTDCDLMRCR